MSAMSAYAKVCQGPQTRQVDCKCSGSICSKVIVVQAGTAIAMHRHDQECHGVSSAQEWAVMSNAAAPTQHVLKARELWQSCQGRSQGLHAGRAAGPIDVDPIYSASNSNDYSLYKVQWLKDAESHTTS
jgi:hypothetical protein